RPPAEGGPLPAGRRRWRTGGATSRGPAPLQDSEDVPASGARPRRRVEQYPVAALHPGMWTDNHRQDEDYGFPPAPPRRDRPRLRLGVTITVTALGILLAAATVVGFVQIVHPAADGLPGPLSSAAAQLPAAPGTAATAPAHGGRA